ncbi:MAG: hypothetical protein K2X47_15980, partial [Bdellovibrionales bacterium]|nr:hypothetical protein [Bdellovibrionales bacterium]
NALMKIGLITNSRSEAHWQKRLADIDQKYQLSNPPDSSASLLNTFAEDSDQIPEIRQGWSATEAAFKRISESCRRNNSSLLVAIIPHEIQMSPEQVPKGLRFKFDPAYAERRIASFLEPLNVPTIKLLESFQKNRERVLPGIDGHLNEYGHELVAKHLFEILELPP